MLELVLGGVGGGTPREVLAFLLGFGDTLPSTMFTVTPSSFALSAKGCGKSSLGFAKT